MIFINIIKTFFIVSGYLIDYLIIFQKIFLSELYSKNIENLMMGGRDISVSHVALGTVRLMRTGGMMGEVVGMAASICKEKNVQPRAIYTSHFSELEKLMKKGVGDPSLPNKQNYNQGGTLLEINE